MTTKDALAWCMEFEENLVQALGQAGSKKEKYTLAKDAMLTCEQALFKQIPIQPILKSCRNLHIYYCAACNAVVDRSRHKHCEKCGQKIDWEGLR